MAELKKKNQLFVVFTPIKMEFIAVKVIFLKENRVDCLFQRFPINKNIFSGEFISAVFAKSSCCCATK